MKVKRWKSAVFVLCVFAVLVGIVGFFEIYSYFYCEINNDPRVIDGVADFEGYSLRGKRIMPSLGGKWEFFYNKWIITDEITAEPDCLVSIPGRWTGAEVDGERIDRTGYASYRMTMKNVEPGLRINMHIVKSMLSYRIYANGILITVNGTMSKEINGGTVSVGYGDVYTYVPAQREDLVIVIEVSGNSMGGINDPIMLSRTDSAGGGNTTSFFLHFVANYSPYIIFGTLLAFEIFNLIMCFALYTDRPEFSSFLFITSVFLHFFTMKNLFASVISPYVATSPPIRQIFLYITSFLVCITFLYYLYKTKAVNISKKAMALSAASAALLALLDILLIGTGAEIIPMLAVFAASGVMLFQLYNSIQQKKPMAKVHAGFAVMVFLLIACELYDGWALPIVSLSTVFVYIVFAIMVFQNILYLVKTRQNNNAALKALRLQQEVSEVKHTALRNQIKPHFIFNTLTSIQNLYHTSTEQGDAALMSFSRHLRANIDSDTRNFVSFEEELRTVENYFSLENLRHGDKMLLLYDIEYTEFDIPILSLQPLVENAIKHGKIYDKEDGFVQITGKREGDIIIVTVEDNGVGFEVADINMHSKGLKNVIERFEYCLNAAIEIESVKNKGTVVKILIPIKNN